MSRALQELLANEDWEALFAEIEKEEADKNEE